MPEIEVLGRGDEAELEAYLSRHPQTSMFLRSNLRQGGIVDEGLRPQATYAAARVGGEIVAVAALCWNGVLLVEGEAAEVGAVARAAIARSGRAPSGMSGPWAQVVAARIALGLTERPAKLDSREDLFELVLGQLRVPEAKLDEVCRRAGEDDRETLARWRYAYEVEGLGAPPSPEREAQTLRTWRPAAATWVLTVEGALVATSAFNAELPDAVQIGGVFTPPALRGRGHARAVVAGSLVEARAAGVQRSILFTPQDNAPAQRAYRALGYEKVGEYGLVLFEV